MALRIEKGGRWYRVNGVAISAEALNVIGAEIFYPHVWRDFKAHLKESGKANIDTMVEVTPALDEANAKIAALEKRIAQLEKTA